LRKRSYVKRRVLENEENLSGRETICYSKITPLHVISQPGIQSVPHSVSHAVSHSLSNAPPLQYCCMHKFPSYCNAFQSDPHGTTRNSVVHFTKSNHPTKMLAARPNIRSLLPSFLSLHVSSHR